MDRLISLQVAIDALGVEPLEYTEYEEGLHTKWADAKEALEKLPSAQPEIVRCKDCKHYAGDGMYCAWDIMVHYEHFYCYHAERGTDEAD